MPDDRPDPPIDPAIQRYVEAAVAKEVARVAGRVRLAAKWFSYGAGLLIVVLIGTGLATRQNLVRVVHEWAFGFDTSLQQALGTRVAVSYSGGFWLRPRRNQNYQSVPFYASHDQAVEVKARVLREGIDTYFVVAILDVTRIDSTDRIHSSHRYPEGWYLAVSDALKQTPSDAERVHLLTFEVPILDNNVSDSVFIEPLITVKGLEGGRP